MATGFLFPASLLAFCGDFVLKSLSPFTLSVFSGANGETVLRDHFLCHSSLAHFPSLFLFFLPLPCCCGVGVGVVVVVISSLLYY